MKRVLVTGAGGFIGRQALPILTSKGFDVHAVSLKTETNTPHVIWHHADLLKTDERKRLIDAVEPTHVLHFAWIATPGVYWTSPLNEQWKDATLDLLMLCKQAGTTRFVASGSCAEYDWNGHTDCAEDKTPLLPKTPYGKAKAECGQSAIVASADDFSTAWGRIFFLYGPHEHPQRLVSSVIRSLLKGEDALCTHGRQIRDFLHVGDIASAFVTLLASDVTGAVNIASGRPVTIREVVETIGRQLDAADRIRLDAIPAPANDPPRLTATVERLQNEVGWSPRFSLEDGIADTINWWRQQSVLYD